jgi:hypothetical protein
LKYANSNNTLVTRRVLEVMGPAFHPALNRSGGEDTLFFHQCYLKGLNLFWDNDVLIGEPTPVDRTTMDYILLRWFNHGTTRITINKILFPRRWRPESIKLFMSSFRNVLIGLTMALLKRDPRRFGKVLMRLAWLFGFGVRLIGVGTIRRTYN